MNFKNIVIYDSGIGGISYLNYLKQFVKQKYIYIADNKNFPYGTKTNWQLQKIIEDIANKMEWLQPSVLVIACNTATLANNNLDKSLQLQKLLNIPVIGTKPQLQRAIDKSYNFKVGLLATLSTINNKYIVNTINHIKETNINSHFVCLPAPQLVEFVENNLFKATKQQKLAIIKPFVNEILKNEVTSVILGCTHFLFLKDEFIELMPNVTIIDSLDEVKDELISTLPDITSNNKEKLLTNKFYTTSPASDVYINNLCKQHSLTYMGVLSDYTIIKTAYIQQNSTKSADFF